MQILNRKNDQNVLSVNDEDCAFEDEGVMVLVLHGEDFFHLLHVLPKNEAQGLIDKYYETYFGSCKSCDSVNFYNSNKSTVICTDCGNKVKLTSMVDHIAGCEKANADFEVRMMKKYQNLGTSELAISIPELQSNSTDGFTKL